MQTRGRELPAGFFMSSSRLTRYKAHRLHPVVPVSRVRRDLCRAQGTCSDMRPASATPFGAGSHGTRSRRPCAIHDRCVPSNAPRRPVSRRRKVVVSRVNAGCPSDRRGPRIPSMTRRVTWTPERRENDVFDCDRCAVLGVHPAGRDQDGRRNGMSKRQGARPDRVGSTPGRREHMTCRRPLVSRSIHDDRRGEKR